MTKTSHEKPKDFVGDYNTSYLERLNEKLPNIRNETIAKYKEQSNKMVLIRIEEIGKIEKNKKWRSRRRGEGRLFCTRE